VLPYARKIRFTEMLGASRLRVSRSTATDCRVHWCGCFRCSGRELIDAVRAICSNEVGTARLYLATWYSTGSRVRVRWPGFFGVAGGFHGRLQGSIPVARRHEAG